MNRLPVSLFLLYLCCWTEISVGGIAPCSGMALKELVCSSHFLHHLSFKYQIQTSLVVELFHGQYLLLLAALALAQ